jgi:hypothetical protein
MLYANSFAEQDVAKRLWIWTLDVHLDSCCRSLLHEMGCDGMGWDRLDAVGIGGRNGAVGLCTLVVL